MGSPVVEPRRRELWSAGLVCSGCRRDPGPGQGSEPQAGEVDTDEEPALSRCLLCPGSTGSAGQGAPHLPSLPPSVRQDVSFFSKILFLLPALYLSYLFRVLEIPNLNDTCLR